MTTTTRLSALGAITGLLLTTLTLVPPSAHAAWSTFVVRHGAPIQLCKVPLADGTRLKVRVDNRRSGHAHRVTLGRERGGSYHEVAVRAGAGRVATGSIKLLRGDQGSVTVHEPNGGAAGAVVRLGQTARC